MDGLLIGLTSSIQHQQLKQPAASATSAKSSQTSFRRIRNPWNPSKKPKLTAVKSSCQQEQQPQFLSACQYLVFQFPFLLLCSIYLFLSFLLGAQFSATFSRLSNSILNLTYNLFKFNCTCAYLLVDCDCDFFDSSFIVSVPQSYLIDSHRPLINFVDVYLSVSVYLLKKIYFVENKFRYIQETCL